jgi:hypothetical protein
MKAKGDRCELCGRKPRTPYELSFHGYFMKWLCFFCWYALVEKCREKNDRRYIRRCKTHEDFEI